MPFLRRTVGALVIVSCLTAASAYAGTYRVHSCSLLDGRVIPTDGWRAEDTGAGVDAAQLCSYGIVVGRGLVASLYADSPPGSYAGWTFTAPPDTTIRGYSLWRTVRAASGAGWFHDYVLSHDAPFSLDQRYLVEFCSRYASCDGLGRGSTDRFSPAKRMSRSSLEVRRHHAYLACDALEAPKRSPGTEPSGYLAIHAAQVDLTDPYHPIFDVSPRGSLLSADGPLEGEQTLSIRVSDKGGGIEQLAVVVDGQCRAERPADINASRCRRPFTTPTPCPLRTDATLVFDTATLANGPHAIQASVTDAAGNETRSDPVVVTTRNGSRPNGRGTSRFVKLAAWLRSRRAKQRASAVVPYGSVRTAEGRLTDAEGKPIGGAVLDVVSNVDRPGAKDKPAGTVTTGDDGRFSYRIARGPSRELRFEYKAYTLDPRAGLEREGHARGARRLPPEAQAADAAQRPARRVSGAAQGRPRSEGHARDDRRARSRCAAAGADRQRQGRCEGPVPLRAYRFRRTLVKARYRFQARLVAQPGYPYRGATSRRVSVVVRP